jgi:branched-chain amino acid transport system permease protein
MNIILQTLVDGIVLGGVMSLAAAGFSLIFGVMNVLNLAHGAMILIGTYLGYVCMKLLGLDPLIAIPGVMAVMYVLGYAIQRTIVEWAVERATLVASLLVTFGLALVLRNAMDLVFSPDVRTLSPSYSFRHFGIGFLSIDMVRLVALGASLCMLAFLSFLLNRTSFGRQIRATAQQPLAARVCGINVPHVYGLTFGIGAAFAGAAGIIIGIVMPFSPNSEGMWTLNCFVVVVLGGVGSPAGAMIGGLMLGLIKTFTAQFIGPEFSNAMMFLILVLMLVLRPQGLLGNVFGESR